MQASSIFDTESTSQKKVVYNYRTEKGTYDNNKMQLVVSPTNNFFMLEGGEMQSYNAKNIYFTKVMHYLGTQGLIGEVVIEHEGGVYTVFPLNGGATNETVIDTIINQGTSTAYTDITLNDLIPRQTSCKFYYTDNASVYFFDQPIEIEGTDEFTDDGSGLSSYIDGAETISYELIPQANISMQSDDDIYIDCSPTGASQEELDTYEVPINSRMTSDLGQKRMEEMTTNFFFFMILVAIAYFVSPTMYKVFITDYVLFKFDYKESDLKRGDINANPVLILHSYRKVLDMLVLLFCAALFCLLMVTDGGILTGTIFAVFIFLSMGVIRDKMNLKENQEVKTNSGVTYSMFDDTAQKDKQYNIPSFVGSIFMDIISNTLKSGLGMAIAVTTAIIINIIVIYGFKQTEALPITIGTLISIFIGLTIGIQIDLRNISTNDKSDSRQTVSESAVDGFKNTFININNKASEQGYARVAPE